MPNEERRPLFLVTRSEQNAPFRGQNFPEPVQGALFPTVTKTLAVIVALPEITENEFTATLEFSRPTRVFELRACPRFDIGRLNRREAFQWFQRVNAEYIDVSSISPSTNHVDVVLTLRSVLTHVESTGPLMFLTDTFDDAFAEEIISTLAHVSAKSWEMCQVPANHPARRAGAIG